MLKRLIFLAIITGFLSYFVTQESRINNITQESFNESSLIKPFHLIDNTISQRVIAILNREWGESNGIFYSPDLISRVFDGFYVMVIENELVGFVGIDREYVKPFISHLYVVPENRRRGYASLLLAHAERFSRKMRYSTVYLWCESEMVPYYRHREWVNANGLISRMIGKVLMTKTL